jgi:hypothetical protein
MSATAKTLASLGLALVGLVVYLGLFLLLDLKVAVASFAIYLGLALTAVLFIVVLTFTFAGDEEAFHG